MRTNYVETNFIEIKMKIIYKQKIIIYSVDILLTRRGLTPADLQEKEGYIYCEKRDIKSLGHHPRCNRDTPEFVDFVPHGCR